MNSNEMILLDTNILIYLLKKDPLIMDFLEKFDTSIFYISVITWMELLTGSFHQEKRIKELERDLELFKRLSVTDNIARHAAHISQEKLRKKKKPHFQDILIAATAVNFQMPLVTNNPKDFRGIKNLKVITPS